MQWEVLTSQSFPNTVIAFWFEVPYFFFFCFVIKKKKKKRGVALWNTAVKRRIRGMESIVRHSHEPSNSVEGHRRLTVRGTGRSHEDGPGPSQRSSQEEEQSSLPLAWQQSRTFWVLSSLPQDSNVFPCTENVHASVLKAHLPVCLLVCLFVYYKIRNKWQHFKAEWITVFEIFARLLSPISKWVSRWTFFPCPLRPLCFLLSFGTILSGAILYGASFFGNVFSPCCGWAPENMFSDLR